MALRLLATFVATGHALSLQSTAFLAPDISSLARLNASLYDNGIGPCEVPAGQVLFLHVMKAGGTSVDTYLACHCRRVGCGVDYSLGPFHNRGGNTNCKASICSTHGDYKDRKELCGDDFEHPHTVITVLREPVSRVFSFYNYQKELGEDLPSIAEFYQECDALTVDEKKTTQKGWLCAGMTNHMVLNTFANKENANSAEMDTDALNQAKGLVSKLNATFFLDDFDHFSEAFWQSSVISDTVINPDHAPCELGHSNPTECPTCAAAPTEAEVELIRKHNEMDIAFYNYAASLPNRKRGL